MYNILVFFTPSGNEKKNQFDRFYPETSTRVARWFVFKPKIPIRVKFGGSCNGKSWYIL
jgi:hypothetical protein